MASNLFIDTSAFVALLDADDELHEAASAFYAAVSRATRRATTHAVIAECYTFFRYHVGRDAALRWLDYLDAARDDGHLRVLYTDEHDGRSAEAFLRRFTDQKLSYVDALTLVAAERDDVAAIFGFDHHLALTGLPLLPGPRRKRGETRG